MMVDVVDITLWRKHMELSLKNTSTPQPRTTTTTTFATRTTLSTYRSIRKSFTASGSWEPQVVDDQGSRL